MKRKAEEMKDRLGGEKKKKTYGGVNWRLCSAAKRGQ
jgi:hypothetical protein